MRQSIDPDALKQELFTLMADNEPRPGDCNCEATEPSWPCRPHRYEEHLAWLGRAAPRLMTAITQGDEFVACERWPADPAEVPEFAPFLAALSPDARAAFAESWRWSSWASYPDAWLYALLIRDHWQTLLPSAERDGLRRAIEDLVTPREAYPLAPQPTPKAPLPLSGYELLADGIADQDTLATEADRLGQLATLAQRGQTMIRDHLRQRREGTLTGC